MNTPARNKPAVLKISRSVTRVGSFQTQGPFPRAKKPLSSASYQSIISTSQGSKGTQGQLRKASEPKSSTQTSTTPCKKYERASTDLGATSPKPVKTPGRKTSVPASPDRLSTSRDRVRTQESLPKTNSTQARGPIPKSKIPVSSGYGNQGSASRKPGHLQTRVSAFSARTYSTDPVQTRIPLPKNNKPVYSGHAFSRYIPKSFVGGRQKQPLPNEPVDSDKDGESAPTDETFIIQWNETESSVSRSQEGRQYIQRSNTRPSLVQNRGPLSKGDEPAFPDQASTSPRCEQKSGCPKSVAKPSDRLSTSPDPLKTRAPVPKTKIPVLSGSRIRGTSTSPGPVHSPVLKANIPMVKGRAFGSTFSVPASEPLSSTRTPRRPPTMASGSAYSLNLESLFTSPRFIVRSKTSGPLHSDRASAGSNRLQARGPKARKPVSSISKSAFRGPGTLQTRGPTPKSNKITSLVNPNRGRASKSLGSDSIKLKSSKQAPESPVPAKTPRPKPSESVASPNKNQKFETRRPGILRTTRSRIPTPDGTCIGQTSSCLPKLNAKTLSDPVKHDGMKKPLTKPEFRLKQSFSPSSSPDRKSQQTPRKTNLADALDKRNRSINELEMKLVENQNLVTEQALRLAESKAVHRAKDETLEQLKSELLTAKDEYDRMHLRLREADLGLEQATCKVNKYLERSTSMEDELKKARDRIANLQSQLKDAETKAEMHCQTKDQLRQDVERMQAQLALDSKRIHNLQQSEKDLRGDLENKDRKITQINQELAARDEEFRNLFDTLKNKHTQLRNQELSMKRLEERYERGSLNRSRLKERNTALQNKIEELKNDLRHYSQMIIANDGKPFFEQVPPGINPNIADGLVPRPEEEQHKRKSKRREK